MASEADLQCIDLLRKILAKSLQPLLNMIAQFTTTGDFEDPFEEFFVKKLVSKVNP